MTTIAGSGLSGNADGAALDAQFVMPMGLAEDREGNLYIADAGGQRIRELMQGGVIRTVAGSGELNSLGLWVGGGYRDGPASSAQFNHPSAVAIGADGAIYVADTLNHCIRKIDGGQVTTFAGLPPFQGLQDGTRTTASFRNPRALVFDEDGTLYVADYGVGLRRISPDGLVSTIPLPPGVDRRLGGIAISGHGGRRMFVVSSLNALLALDANLKLLWVHLIAPPKVGTRLFSEQGELRKDWIAESRSALGHPFALAALDDDSVLYTDLYTNSLRQLAIRKNASAATLLGRWPVPDAPNRSGAFSDGPLPSAEFDAPSGLVRRRDGSVVVADAGNRRLRAFGSDFALPRRTPPPAIRLPQFDSKTSGLVNLHVDIVPKISDHYYRIAFIGNSFSYWDTRWNESIEGLLEKRLNANRAASGPAKPVKVFLLFPYFETFGAVTSYAREVLSRHVVDAVIWQINPQTIVLPYAAELAKEPATQSASATAADFARFWQPKLISALRATDHVLRVQHIRFFAVLHPIGAELTPLESADLEEFEEPYYPTNGFHFWEQSRIGDQLRAAVRDSGVPSIDLYAAFSEAERASRRRALFGTQDEHFSKYGRSFAAKAIAEQLERLRPWLHSP